MRRLETGRLLGARGGEERSHKAGKQGRRTVMGKGLRTEAPGKDQRTGSKGWCTNNFSVGGDRRLTELDIISKDKGQPRVRGEKKD